MKNSKVAVIALVAIGILVLCLTSFQSKAQDAAAPALEPSSEVRGNIVSELQLIRSKLEKLESDRKQEQPPQTFQPLRVVETAPALQQEPAMAATLIKEPEVAPPPQKVVEPRSARPGDVVAMWIKTSEWNRNTAVSLGQDSGMKAYPIMVVGIVTSITDTHVTLSGRKWFNSDDRQDDKFFALELIPLDILYRVQVLGSAGEQFNSDVLVNNAPTAGLSRTTK